MTQNESKHKSKHAPQIQTSKPVPTFSCFYINECSKQESTKINAQQKTIDYSPLETILHWDGKEIGLLIDEFAKETATKQSRNDRAKKHIIGKIRAREHRNNTESRPFFSVLEEEPSWESMETLVGRVLSQFNWLYKDLTASKFRPPDHLSGDLEFL